MAEQNTLSSQPSQTIFQTALEIEHSQYSASIMINYSANVDKSK